MAIKGTIRTKVNGALQEYFPKTTYDSVVDSGSNLKTDIDALKNFKSTAGSKLDGIAANATKTEKSSTNGNIKINGTETTVYTHPADANTRHVTDAQISSWTAKETTSGAQSKADTALNSAKKYTDTKVADIVSSAPETLDTLNELAKALGNDPNFATTVATQIGNKVDKVSGKGLSTNDYTTAEKTKLAGIATGANNYTHPATSGNKHIPSGGSSGQILRWSADGTAVWGNDNNTTYGVVSKTANGLAPQLPNETTTTKYLRQDGTWAVPPNTTYGVATTSANGLMSKEDKTKLNGIATGANKTVLNNTVTSTSTSEAATANAVKTAYDKANHSHPYAPTTHTHTDLTNLVSRGYLQSNVVSDVNKAVTNGKYKYIGSLNLPSDGTWLIDVTVEPGGRVAQLATCIYGDDDGKLFTRRSQNDLTLAWEAWKQIATTSSTVANADTVDGKHASDFLQTAGGSMSGALNFANNIWNQVGDDAYIGDCNASGCVGIKGSNGDTGLYFVPYSGSYSQKLFSDGAGSLITTGNFRATGDLISNSANGIRVAYGNYGFFIRNDGTNTYFMLTNSGDPYGGYSDLRPMYFNNSNGNLFIGHPTTVNGGITCHNMIVGNSDGNLKRTTISTANPSGGVNGDVWIKYS